MFATTLVFAFVLKYQKPFSTLHTRQKRSLLQIKQKTLSVYRACMCVRSRPPIELNEVHSKKLCGVCLHAVYANKGVEITNLLEAFPTQINKYLFCQLTVRPKEHSHWKLSSFLFIVKRFRGASSSFLVVKPIALHLRKKKPKMLRSIFVCEFRS